jgi:hypothetical protein
MGSASLLRSFARSVVVAVIFVLAFEATTRGMGWLDPTTRPDPYLGLAGTPPLYPAREAGNGTRVRRTAPNKNGTYRVLGFAAEKPADEFRVFCIGGSSVRSDAFMDPDGSFPAMLEIYLSALMPDKTARVINAGGGGMGSLQNLEVLREILDYDPDLVLVYPEGGEKNFLPPSPLGAMAGRDDESPLRAAARRELAQLRLYGFARETYRRLMPSAAAGGPRPSAFSAFVLSVISQPFAPENFTRLFEMKIDRVPPVMKHPIPPEQIATSHARYARVLDTMVELCADDDVPMMLMLPVFNLKSSFYLRFYIDPSEIQTGRIAEWRKAYETGLVAKRAGRYEEAIASLETVRSLYVEDRDQILAFDLAECHEALGRTQRAQREYARPFLTHPVRALIREAADEHGVPLIDPFGALVAVSAGGVPGFDEFSDAFHPMPKTNRIIARSVVNALRREGAAGELLPDDSETARRADRDVYERMARCRIPVHSRMSKACAEGDWAAAVAIAREVPEDVLFGSMFVETMYLGWASVRADDIDGAKQVYDVMRKQLWRPGRRGAVPALKTDQDIVRVAYGGDLFAWL